MADSSLYGIPRPKHDPKAKISASTSLSFTAQLTSLLASTRPAKTSTSAAARPRPPRKAGGKDDIFTTHNKGAKKRALADISTTTEDGLSVGAKQDIGGVDEEVLKRSRRKMEEKAKIYAAMKRGEYVDLRAGKGGVNDEREGLVDFDRKWAEDEAAGREATSEESSESDEGEEVVEYVDEFGRQRMGTRSEADRARRRVMGAKVVEEELSELTARPAMPTNIIYGDTVQVGAFNPDEPIAAKMEELARKRDRSLTPPEDTHYDATKEVRTKGVGFYQFSGDKEARAKEMENLRKEREETERKAKEREDKKERRRKEIEEKRKAIREKRVARDADKFLAGLGAELGDGAKDE
jgi:hypothetical protein